MTKALKFGCAGLLAIALAASSASAQIGKRYPSERKVVKDDVTGADLIVLTDGKASDAKIYQNASAMDEWTASGSSSAPQAVRQAGRAYAVNETTGDIVQLTEGAGLNIGSLNIARKSMKLYFLRDAAAAAAGLAAPATTPAGTTPPTTAPAAGANAGRRTRAVNQIIELDVARVLADSEKGTMSAASSYERVCGTLPAGMGNSGGFGLDVDEKTAVFGANGGDVGTHLLPGVEVMKTPAGASHGAGPGGLRSMNLETGEIKVIIDTPFEMGHVQMNPWVPGEIIYCHETGGDAPQRVWTVNMDGTGNRPLHKETPLEWITHETVITKDEVMFLILGHQARLRAEPTGIAILNLRTDHFEIIGQLDEKGSGVYGGPGGFWHCNGSADGHWAVGDTFGGNVWLLDRTNGNKMTKLISDVKMKPDHAHPTFSDDSSKLLIQSGHWTDGTKLQLVVVPIPKDLSVLTDKKGN